MYKFFALLLLVVSSLNGWSQTETQFSQSMFNPIKYNPAFAGNADMMSFTGGWKNQWMGIPNGIEAYFGNIDGRFLIFGVNSGVGLGYFSETLGNQKNNSINLDYAYVAELDEGTFSVGTKLMWLNSTITGTDYIWLDGVDDYHTAEETLNIEAAGSCFSAGIGAYYDRKNIFGGFSLLNLNNPSINMQGVFNTQFKRSLYLNAGYRFQSPQSKMKWEPSFLAKFQGHIWQYDVNLLGYLNNKYWAGLSYRYQDAFVILLGGEIKNDIRVGISYDISTNQLVKSTDGSFEILLNYKFVVKSEKRSKRYKSVRYL